MLIEIWKGEFGDERPTIHAYTHMKELQKPFVDLLRYNEHWGVFPVRKVMAGTDLISEPKF